MSEEYIKKLLYTGQIVFEKGKFSVLGHRGVFIFPEMLVHMGTEFEKEVGSRKVYSGIYNAAKIWGGEFTCYFLNLGIPPEEVPFCCIEVLTMSGWGNIVLMEFTKDTMMLYLKNLPIPSASGIKTCRLEICSVLKGIFAGIYEEIMNCKAVCIEKRCLLKGDSFCEFVVERK